MEISAANSQMFLDKLKERLSPEPPKLQPRPPKPSGGTKRPHKLSSWVYFANWYIYERKHFPTDIDFTSVDGIYYAFLLIDTVSGKVDFLDTWGDLEVPLDSPLHPGTKVHGLVEFFVQLKQLYPHLKVSFSIGGWGTLQRFEAVVLKRQTMETFVTSCCDLIRKYGFDGIDIDWEYPQSPQEGNLLKVLLEELRYHLDQTSPNLSLSVAAPAGSDNIRQLDIAQLDMLIDKWNVMCYDYTGYPWSSRVGYHSNLFGHNGDNNLSGESVLQNYLKSGASAHKLILGMPLYGRKFGGVASPQIGTNFNKNALNDEGIIEYKKLPFEGTSEFFDHKKVGAFCYDPKSQTLVTYDNIDSVKVKAQYIKLHGLGGGMFWDSAGDKTKTQPSLIQTFHKQLNS